MPARPVPPRSGKRTESRPRPQLRPNSRTRPGLRRGRRRQLVGRRAKPKRGTYRAHWHRQSGSPAVASAPPHSASHWGPALSRPANTPYALPIIATTIATIVAQIYSCSGLFCPTPYPPQSESSEGDRRAGSLNSMDADAHPSSASRELPAEPGRSAHPRAATPRRVKLVYATSELVVWNKDMAGTPIMLVDGEVEPAPSLYFALSAGGASLTSRTYARALVAWWKFLLRESLAWWSVSASDLKAFALLYHRATATLYLTAVSQFYAWAHRQGLMDYRPFQAVGRRGILSGSADPAVPQVKVPGQPRGQPKLISREEFRAVLEASPRKSPALILRDELTAECGHYMALRRGGVRGLMVDEFLSMRPDAKVHVLALDQKFVKGGQELVVAVPRQLVHKVLKYIRIYRKRLVESLRDRDPAYREPPELFLTERGTPLSPSYISTTWRRSARRAGIAKRFHLNRHTAATGLASGALHKNINAQRVVMAQLGHKSPKSSDRYVHLAEVERELLAHAFLLNDLWNRDHAT